MAHVFISYKHEDQPVINRLVNDLQKNGVQVWLDRNDIEPGNHWESAIVNAMNTGHFFLACFSKARTGYEESYANEELELALELLRKGSKKHEWFYPITLDGTPIPNLSISAAETLNSYQHLNLSVEWDSNIQKLLRKIYLPEQEDQVKIYSFIEKVIAIYSLVFWRSPQQKPPILLEDSEWESKSFTLDCENIDWIHNSLVEPGELFECFSKIVTHRSSYESEPFEGYYVTPNPDYWYTFRWKSLFGYELDITVNPEKNGSLYEIVEALYKRTHDNTEEGHPLHIRGYAIEIKGLRQSGNVFFVAGNGYLLTSISGYNDLCNEWVIYFSEDIYLRGSDLLNLIRGALDWKSIFEPNLEKAIRILESDWKGLYPYFNKDFLAQFKWMNEFSHIGFSD
ncbi:toll/interleukin-1 receptor domain-containing protein [Adhaeribacter rhizoryzae]|uniref:Toll/interleukin-1 receptor domain-containing protein n=1 Tax=Adhaeribacter rhizoryzae TaxID=2607907 RepID=A0A5M6CUW4_9BACT|nr:toll/interleukin-1 receptor domain-containing protein [Adhaeribacter rhizoryzae]KAA5538853.1 toll/interleukin-1 receptor domain-containing protein [Adhaeribacter rhizoryzae]